MRPAEASDFTGHQEAPVPVRDWVLLAVISLSTISLLAISAELLTRWLFPVYAIGLNDCFAKDDHSGDSPVKANSVCRERIAESKFLAEYKFNTQGHRAGMEMGAKQPGTFRIVMIGSSFAMGLFVPRDMTFAALLPAELSRETRRNIELYNEATGGEFRGGPYPIRSSVRNFSQVLSAAPDMILWVVTPNDFRNASHDVTEREPPATIQAASVPDKRETSLPTFWKKFQVAVSDGTLGEKLRTRWEESRTSLVLKHVLIATESQDQYVTSYLKNEEDAGFLKAEPSVQWQRLLQTFQIDAAQFESQARAAGIPFVVVLVPNRAQAAMLSMSEWPVGYNPYKLDDELRAIIVSNGGTYIDILPDFRLVPNPEHEYFPVDGHPDADGHALIARLIAKELTSGAVPALKVQAQPQQVEPKQTR
jgi:hypothetical protein